MWTLVGGKMVWVPMAEAGEYGSETGGGSGSASSEDGGDDAGQENVKGDGGQGDEGLPPDLDDWMTPDARAAFEYDPFAPKEEGAGEGEGGKSKDGDADGSELRDGKAAAPKEKGEADKESGEGKEGDAGKEAETSEERIKRLEKQLSDYQEMMHKQLMDQTARGQDGKKEKGKEGAEGEGDPLEAMPQYQPFKIPDAIKEKIFSEKPEDMMEGLGMMMQGVAQITHYNVRKEMSKMMDERINKTVDTKQSELTEKQKAEQTQSEIRKDWEEHYPDLADKDLQPLVAHIGQQVVSETGAKEWNEKLRDQIAARVRKVLGRKEEQRGEGEGEKTPEGKKPPFSAKGSARKGAPKNPNPVSQDISDTLGLG